MPSNFLNFLFTVMNLRMNKLLVLVFLVALMGLMATAGTQEEGGKVDLEDAVESREVRGAQRDFIPRRNRERKGQKNKNKKATRTGQKNKNKKATRKGQKNKNKKATRKGQKNKSKKNKAPRSG